LSKWGTLREGFAGVGFKKVSVRVSQAGQFPGLGIWLSGIVLNSGWPGKLSEGRGGVTQVTRGQAAKSVLPVLATRRQKVSVGKDELRAVPYPQERCHQARDTWRSFGSMGRLPFHATTVRNPRFLDLYVQYPGSESETITRKPCGVEANISTFIHQLIHILQPGL